MMWTMTYDTERLAELGRRHKKLRAALAAVRAELAPEIIAADQDGVEQKTIAELSGYTRESVRLLCLTPEQQEEEKKKRRARTRKG